MRAVTSDALGVLRQPCDVKPVKNDICQLNRTHALASGQRRSEPFQAPKARHNTCRSRVNGGAVLDLHLYLFVWLQAKYIQTCDIWPGSMCWRRLCKIRRTGTTCCRSPKTKHFAGTLSVIWHSHAPKLLFAQLRLGKPQGDRSHRALLQGILGVKAGFVVTTGASQNTTLLAARRGW